MTDARSKVHDLAECMTEWLKGEETTDAYAGGFVLAETVMMIRNALKK